MAEDEPQDPSLDLGPWLESLRVQAGLSSRALAQAMGVDRSNLRDWLNGNGGMTARNLLLFLDAVGAEIQPASPEKAPKAVNAEISLLRDRLAAVEATIDSQGEAQTKALKALAAGIRKLERQLVPAARGASQGKVKG